MSEMVSSLTDCVRTDGQLYQRGCPEWWRPGRQRLLASWQFSHAGNRLDIQGNHLGAYYHNDCHWRHAGRQSSGAKWRGDIGYQRDYRTKSARQKALNTDLPHLDPPFHDDTPY